MARATKSGDRGALSTIDGRATLTIRKASQMLNVTERTIRSMIRMFHLVGIRQSKRITRVYEFEVEAMLRERVVARLEGRAVMSTDNLYASLRRWGKLRMEAER